MTAEDVTIDAFTADPIFALRCMDDGQDVTEGMTVSAGETIIIDVYVDVLVKENFEGKMYVNTSAGNFEVDIVYEMTVGVGENSTTLTMFPNPANESVTLQGKNLGEAFTVEQIADRSIVIDGDIGEVLQKLALAAPIGNV